MRAPAGTTCREYDFYVRMNALLQHLINEIHRFRVPDCYDRDLTPLIRGYDELVFLTRCKLMRQYCETWILHEFFNQ